MVDTMIGKNAIRNEISTLACNPVPNQMMNTGAIATLGTICDDTSSG